jgi:acid phosphatase
MDTPTVTMESNPGTLLVLGDWGAGTAEQRAVAGAMKGVAETSPVAAILTTGDNFYSNNAEKLLEPFSWALGEIDFWIAWGNHDIANRRRIALLKEAFDDPPRWTVYEWGTYDVVILDSNQVANKEQIAFLSQTMEESDRPTIIVFHHPPLTCGRHRGTDSVLDNWVPLFDEDVVLVLSGHDHNYQRFLDDGTVYVVTGGGGRGLYDVGECPVDHPPRLAFAVEYNFLVIYQTEGALTVTALNTNRQVIDEFTVPLD